jgi:hypothetical protein
VAAAIRVLRCMVVLLSVTRRRQHAPTGLNTT